MNMSISTTGSSSCQCATTLYGQNKETQKSVNIIHLQLRIMLADFRAVVGHSWDLDQKRNGTGLVLKPDGIWARTAEMMKLKLNT